MSSSVGLSEENAVKNHYSTRINIDSEQPGCLKARLHIFVLAMIGMLFLATGLYLLIGSVGTIASVIAGSALTLGGIGSLVRMVIVIKSPTS